MGKRTRNGHDIRARHVHSSRSARGGAAWSQRASPRAMSSFSSLSTGLSTGGILGMRGLNVFIQDIRNAPSKEHEQKRVDKELANIRKKFKNTDLSSYDKKK